MLLASVLVLCVLALSAQAPARSQRGSVLQSWILTVAGPVATALGTVSRGVSGTSTSFVDSFTARAENERLRRQVERQNEELFRLRAEVGQIRGELGLRASAPFLPSVVASAPVLLLERRAGLQSALIGIGALPSLPELSAQNQWSGSRSNSRSSRGTAAAPMPMIRW